LTFVESGQFLVGVDLAKFEQITVESDSVKFGRIGQILVRTGAIEYKFGTGRLNQNLVGVG